MAKVTEGNPYYYAPGSSNNYALPDLYYIFKRGDGAEKCLALDVSQDNASLIVDALNDHYLNQAVLNRI